MPCIGKTIACAVRPRSAWGVWPPPASCALRSSCRTGSRIAASMSGGGARWTPDERAIVFVGQDADGHAGLYRQDFVPGRDTGATRRQLVASLPGSATESFGISPDGAHIVVSDALSSQSLMLVDGVKGIE